MAFSKFYAFDALAGVLKRDVGLAALTSDGYVGTQWDQGAAALTDCVLVINVESIDKPSEEPRSVTVGEAGACSDGSCGMQRHGFLGLFRRK